MMPDEQFPPASDLLAASGSLASSSLRGARLKGTAGAVTNGLEALTDIARTGTISQTSLKGAASSAAAMVGVRMIPGVGWAMLAYSAADVGSRAILGKPFGETMVGKPIAWMGEQAGRGALATASGLTNAIGWKSGSDFLDNVIKPWAFPEDVQNVKSGAGLTAEQRTTNAVAAARSNGLLPKDDSAPILIKGPETQMTAADTYEHTPKRAEFEVPQNTPYLSLTRDAPGSSLTSIEPSESEIANRRQMVLAADTDSVNAQLGVQAAIQNEAGLTNETPAPSRMSAILSAAKEMEVGPLKISQPASGSAKDRRHGVDFDE